MAVDHPWQVGLLFGGESKPGWVGNCIKKPKKAFLFRCGGTLISQSHVLTSASCTYGKTIATIELLVGANNIKDDGDKVHISNISIHPLYNPTTLQNDFSILTLAQPVTFTDTVSPACLPSDLTQDYAGQEGTVTGWGKKTQNATHYTFSHNLQETNVKSYKVDTSINHAEYLFK